MYVTGFQTHPFIARLARNWPQSNDGQSQHLCPAASCIISIRHTEYEKVAYLKKLIYWLFVLVNMWFISLSIGKLLLTPRIQIFFFFESGSNSFKQRAPSVNTFYLPTISEVSFMSLLFLLCFKYFPFLQIQQKMGRYERGGYKQHNL